MPQHWQGKRFFFANIMASDLFKSVLQLFSPLGLSPTAKACSRHGLRVPRPVCFRGRIMRQALLSHETEKARSDTDRIAVCPDTLL
jgi:hypothetical protein